MGILQGVYFKKMGANKMTHVSEKDFRKFEKHLVLLPLCKKHDKHGSVKLDALDTVSRTCPDCVKTGQRWWEGARNVYNEIDKKAEWGIGVLR